MASTPGGIHGVTDCSAQSVLHRTPRPLPVDTARRQDKRTTKANRTILLRDHRRRARRQYDPGSDDSCMSTTIPSTTLTPPTPSPPRPVVPGAPCNVICLKLLPIYVRGLASINELGHRHRFKPQR